MESFGHLKVLQEKVNVSAICNPTLSPLMWKKKNNNNNNKKQHHDVVTIVPILDLIPQDHILTPNLSLPDHIKPQSSKQVSKHTRFWITCVV